MADEQKAAVVNELMAIQNLINAIQNQVDAVFNTLGIDKPGPILPPV